MVWEAARELREPETCETASLTFATIFFEAIATSIDAFVVGVSFAATGKNIVLYSGAIGVMTFLCCGFVLVLGRRLGERFGARPGSGRHRAHPDRPQGVFGVGFGEEARPSPRESLTARRRRSCAAR